MVKIWCRFHKLNKNSEKVFPFEGKCIWIRSDKFPQSWIGYLTLAVNVLTNTPKIGRINMGDIFQINFTQNDEKP